MLVLTNYMYNYRVLVYTMLYNKLNIYSCHPAYSYLRKNEYWNLMRLDYDSWKEKASTFEIKVRGVDVHARKTLRKEKLSV